MRTQNPKLRFLLNLLAFVVVVFLMDQGIGRLLRYYYFQQSSGLYFRTTMAIEKTTASILILGTSRANHHYVPEIFEQIIGFDCYNAGRDGMPIEYHEAVLKLILKRYLPRLIILDVVPSDFKYSENRGERLHGLWPYVSRHPELKALVRRRGYSERIRFLSQIYPFNSYILTIAVGNMGFNKKRSGDIKGYGPLKSHWLEPLKTSALGIDKVDAEAVQSFRRFIALASSRSVPLYVVVSPVFQRWLQPVLTLETAKAICKETNVSYLDFSQSEEFQKHPEYFRDTWHLNHVGATRFSALLAETLCPYVQSAKR
jgi:hypothetical protein